MNGVFYVNVKCMRETATRPAHNAASGGTVPGCARDAYLRINRGVLVSERRGKPGV